MPEISQGQLEEFGRAVKTARAFKGWTLDQLAFEALQRDNAKGYLSQIEKGKRQITARTAAKIIKALDMPEAALAPFIGAAEVEEDEVTKVDRDAERLIARTEREALAPGTGTGLLVALAYDFAEGPFLDLQTAYQGLRSALEAAKRIKDQGALPANTGDQVQRIKQEMARLNHDGLRAEAAEYLDAEMERLDAQRDALFTLQLDQDRIRNDPQAAANRLIADLHRQAPPGGVWSATRDLIREWRKRGEKDGAPFDLQVALALAKHIFDRARGPQKGPSLVDLGLCHLMIGERSSHDGHLKVGVNAFRKCLTLMPRRADPNGWAAAQNGLGGSLLKLGERASDPDRLRAAIDAFEAALQV